VAQVPASQIYAAELAAGFDPSAALIGTQIAEAESGGNPVALGDTSIEDGTWGPSYGLWQIRTVKGQTGQGGTRDISALSAGVSAQAAAEYQISRGGTDWSPWTTYRTGAYRRFASLAQSAAAAVGGPSSKSGSSSSAAGGAAVPVYSSQPFPTFGPGWLPWNLPSDVGNAIAGQASSTLSGVRQVALEAVVGLAGVGLVVAGLYALARPTIRRKTQEAEKLAGAIL